MKLNREIQREILTQLSKVYPKALEVEKISFPNEDDFQTNLFYLEEHELIESEGKRDIFGMPPCIFVAKITAKGLDFLEDDGGLSAIFNTVTVKFDAENIRSLIQEKVVPLSWPQEKKQTFTDKLKVASGDVLKKLIDKIIEIGLDSLDKPGVIDQLMKIFS